MTDLLAAAERVKSAVETSEAERYTKLTQDELDRLHTYQFTMPTGPQPGFVYKRERWRIPGETRWWHGQHEGHVRWAIGEFQQGSRIPPNYYEGPLDSFWLVYTCELDPNDSNFVLHRPREVKVIG